MKLLLGLFLLLYAPVSYGMRAQDVRSSEESFSCSDSDDESWHRAEEAKKPKFETIKPTSSGSCYIVDFDNPQKVLAFKNRGALIKKYLRSIAKAQGFTNKSVSDGFELTVDNPSKRKATSFSLVCPDTSCNIKLQTESSEAEVIRHLFRHWFLTAMHQPVLYNELSQLIGEDKVEAQNLYRTYGKPKSKVVSIARFLEVQPMEVDKPNEELQDEWEEENEHREELLSSPKSDYSQELGIQDMEIDETWYIATDNVGQTSSFIILEAPTREQVVAQFMESQSSSLNLDCKEVKQQGKIVGLHEEIQKQLGVQRSKKLKTIICPLEPCDFMVTQESKDAAKELDPLYHRMALHYLQSHTTETDNVLVRKAAKLASPSFKQALASRTNVNDPSKQRLPQ